MLQYIGLVAIGGAAGSVTRFLATVGATRLWGTSFPAGTLFVNITGSLMIGVIVELLARKFNGSEALRLLLVTGFLGGYTTFSSFSLDIAVMWERGQPLLAVSYMLISNGLGILALFAGMWAVRSLA